VIRRARRVAVACLSAALLLTGCWDRHETSELAIVDAYGFDWIGGQYAVTAEVVNPALVSAPGQGQPQAGGPASVLLLGQGATPALAIADVTHDTSREVFWPTARVLVIGQALAQRGIGPVIDAIVHNPLLRLIPRVMVTHETARALLSAGRTGVEVTIGRNLVRLARVGYQDQSLGYAPQVFDVMRWQSQAGRAPMILAVDPVQAPVARGPGYNMDHTAVLSGDRLAAWLPPPLVRMALWVTDRFSRSTFFLACPDRPTEGGAFAILRGSAGSHPVFAAGELAAIRVDLVGRGALDQSPCPGSTLGQLQRLGQAEIRAELQDVVQWAQGERLDIFGWGQDVYAVAPGLWRSQLAADWPQVFAHLPVELEVQLNLQYSGLGQP
jgi:spore germination protein KC